MWVVCLCVCLCGWVCVCEERARQDRVSGCRVPNCVPRSLVPRGESCGGGSDEEKVRGEEAAVSEGSPDDECECVGRERDVGNGVRGEELSE